jgi:hypothetical protein
MSDIADKFLQGKVGKARKAGEPNPFDLFEEAFQSEGNYTLEMLQDCLLHAYENKLPLPDNLMAVLINSVNNLLTGNEDYLLKKAPITPKTRSIKVIQIAMALQYVAICEKHGYDKNPV